MLGFILEFFLMPGWVGMRLSQDTNMWLIDQKMVIEYMAHRIIDRARRDREAHERRNP